MVGVCRLSGKSTNSREKLNLGLIVCFTNFDRLRVNMSVGLRMDYEADKEPTPKHTTEGNTTQTLKNMSVLLSLVGQTGWRVYYSMATIMLANLRLISMARAFTTIKTVASSPAIGLGLMSKVLPL